MKQKIIRQIKITAMGTGYLLALAAALIMGWSLGKEDFEAFFGALICYAMLWMGAHDLRLTLKQEEEQQKKLADLKGE